MCFALKRKDNSFLGPSPAFPVVWMLPYPKSRCPLPKSLKDPFGWFRNVNPDSLSEECSFFWKEPILSNNLPVPPLGPTNPCPNAVHTEPFSTSVFNQKSQLNICYFHQDLHKGLLHARSRKHFKAKTLASKSFRPPTGSNIRNKWPAEYRLFKKNTWAPSIFRASWFGRWVVTHSLADSDFHGHRPAV